MKKWSNPEIKELEIKNTFLIETQEQESDDFNEALGIFTPGKGVSGPSASITEHQA